VYVWLIASWLLVLFTGYWLGRDAERSREGGTRDQRRRAIRAEGRLTDLQQRLCRGERILCRHDLTITSPPLDDNQVADITRRQLKRSRLTGRL